MNGKVCNPHTPNQIKKLKQIEFWKPTLNFRNISYTLIMFSQQSILSFFLPHLLNLYLLPLRLPLPRRKRSLPCPLLHFVLLAFSGGSETAKCLSDHFAIVAKIFFADFAFVYCYFFASAVFFSAVDCCLNKRGKRIRKSFTLVLVYPF